MRPAFAAFAITLLAASIATAQPKPGSTEARRARALFDEGVALSDEGKWSDALAAFQKSNDLVPSASARHNIASTLRALGRYVEARKILEQVLAEAPKMKPPIKPALKKEMEKLLAEVKKKIVTVTLKATPVEADVQMDGNPVKAALDGTLEIDPGKHVFVVTASGYETTTVTQTLDTSGAEVVLVAPKIVPKIVQQETPIYARAWFIATSSVVVLGAATVGIIFATRPKTTPAAGPPPATVDRVIPAAVRF